MVTARLRGRQKYSVRAQGLNRGPPRNILAAPANAPQHALRSNIAPDLALGHWPRLWLDPPPLLFFARTVAALDRLASPSRSSIQRCARSPSVDALSTSVPYIPPWRRGSLSCESAPTALGAAPESCCPGAISVVLPRLVATDGSPDRRPSCRRAAPLPILQPSQADRSESGGAQCARWLPQGRGWRRSSLPTVRCDGSAPRPASYHPLEGAPGRSTTWPAAGRAEPGHCALQAAAARLCCRPRVLRLCGGAARTRIRELTTPQCFHTTPNLTPAGAAGFCGTPQGDEH